MNHAATEKCNCPSCLRLRFGSPLTGTSKLNHADRIAQRKLVAATLEGRPVYRVNQRDMEELVRATIACYADRKFPAARAGIEEIARICKMAQADGTISSARSVFDDYMACIEEYAEYFAESPLILTEFKAWYTSEKARIVLH
jgi:hypothetical protein